VGTVPLIGINTAILAVIAISLRLNMALIQLANYAAFPIQLVLYIPFIKAGEFIFNQKLIPLSFYKIRMMFAEDWILAIKKLWMAHLMGIFVWFIVWIPLSFILYYTLYHIFMKIGSGSKMTK